MTPNTPSDPQFDTALTHIAQCVSSGDCVLFLGAGVHAGPPDGSKYAYPVRERPMIGSGLSKALAGQSEYKLRFPRDDVSNLQRVAQDFEGQRKRTGLIAALRAGVQTNKTPSAALRALAQLGFRWIITTNYDDLFERALATWNKRPFISIYKKQQERPRELAYGQHATAVTPFLFKIHGDLETPESIVITDEDYIHFLMRMGSREYDPIPGKLLQALKEFPTLFIGYSLRDYNLRLLFKTMRWKLDAAEYPPSYSVDFKPDPLIMRVWQHQNGYIDFIARDVWTFVPVLYERVMGDTMPR